MTTPSAPRSRAPALLTDLYQLTMACGYWRAGMARHEAVFHLFFRTAPFGGAFAVACGLEYALDHLDDFRLDEADLEYLAGLTGGDGTPLLDRGFVAELAEMRLEVEVDALPEGTVLFPGEPLLRVRGPLLQGQLLETPLLNLIGFQTLAATKAARICLAAEGDPVVEFGLRRAQGMDGALAASRAAYVGGCVATSNVLAGRRFGIPVRGTHAHSFVMVFDDEREAFEAYGRAVPGNCILLVDTYDTLQGVRHAVEAGRRLASQGIPLAGIRLDSGDLGALSRKARRILDAEGFGDTVIVGSSDLDEHRIADLKAEGAPIGLWGVGTRLTTAFDEPALTAVYKLGAIRAPGGDWRRPIKLSDDPAKSTLPGIHQVRRYEREGVFAGDVVYDSEAGPSPGPPVDRETGATLDLPADAHAGDDLLTPVHRHGARVAEPPTLDASRNRCLDGLSRLPNGVRRLRCPDRYPVGIDERLAKMRDALARERGRP